MTLQDELTIFDKWELRDGDLKRLTSHRMDYESQDSRRKEIMAAVHEKLKEYGMTTILLHSRLRF